jgi:hypothetical protein
VYRLSALVAARPLVGALGNERATASGIFADLGFVLDAAALIVALVARLALTVVAASIFAAVERRCTLGIGDAAEIGNVVLPRCAADALGLAMLKMQGQCSRLFLLCQNGGSN